MPLTHNSETREDEPQWGDWIDQNRSRLPDNAFADDERGFPHHWVVSGSGEDENGRWTDGDMFLHRGGLNAAWAAAMGARTGERASQNIVDHLRRHRRVLGLEEEEAQVGAVIGESDGGFASFPAVLSLPHVATRIFNTPLLIEPGKLRLIVAVLARRAAGAHVAAQAEAGRRRQPQYEIVNGTAIIPVFGSLVHRTTGLDAMSGLTSYQSISQHLSAALEDPQVNRVLLEIDSPGGEVGGLAELAGQIRTANQQKPVIAYANSAASAAYWIGSAADKLYLSPEAAVGSIGVIYLHMDVRAAQEKEGVAITEVFAGSHKVDTSPYRALSTEARDQVQGYINAYYEQFVMAVAQQRGLNPQTVRDTEAALYIGGQAVDRGLADGVRTRAEILQASEFIRQGEGHMSLHTAVCPVNAGEQLARRLNQAIEEQATEERPRSRIIEDMADEAGIEPSTVNQILNGSINCPPLERLEAFSRVLDVPMQELVSAAEDDGCEYNQEDNPQARSDDMKPLASIAALRAAYPKLVQEIETAASTKAAADERQRILDIRSIAPRGCENLAAECMFEKPCSPEAAAKQFLLAQQQQNKVQGFYQDGPEPVPYAPSAEQPEDLEAHALIAAAKQTNAH